MAMVIKYIITTNTARYMDTDQYRLEMGTKRNTITFNHNHAYNDINSNYVKNFTYYSNNFINTNDSTHCSNDKVHSKNDKFNFHSENDKFHSKNNKVHLKKNYPPNANTPMGH